MEILAFSGTLLKILVQVQMREAGFCTWEGLEMEMGH